jgi:hypothetical protein
MARALSRPSAFGRALFRLRQAVLPVAFCALFAMMMPVCSSWAGNEAPGEAPVGGGPFPTRNYNPVQLTILSLPIEKATTVPRGGVEIAIEAAESSALMYESRPDAEVQIKFETFRSSLTLKYGLPYRLELDLEIPFYVRWTGFLDPFVVWTEKTFNYPNPDRDEFTEGQFGGYTITHNGNTIVSGVNNQSGIGDIVLGAKCAILSEGPRRPALAARLAVKFPTGDFSKQFGSGEYDVGIGLALQKTVWDRLALYLNQNIVFPTGTFADTGLTLDPVFTSGGAAEWLWTPWFSPVVQLDYYTTPFHGTGTRALDNTVFEIAFGVNVRPARHLLWQLYGIENFNTPEGEAAADFTLGTTVALELN